MLVELKGLNGLPLWVEATVVAAVECYTTTAAPAISQSPQPRRAAKVILANGQQFDADDSAGDVGRKIADAQRRSLPPGMGGMG